MARDRQRAKQRRAERQRRRRGPRRAPRARARRRRPTPIRSTHSSAEVDEARLAEAGARTLPDGGEPTRAAPRSTRTSYGDDELDDARRDAVEGDAVSAAPRPAPRAEHPRRQRGRVLTFLGHCVDELRRVQWPDRRQVGQATAVVLGFVVIAGGYLGLLDAIWQPLIDAIL